MKPASWLLFLAGVFFGCASPAPEHADPGEPVATGAPLEPVARPADLSRLELEVRDQLLAAYAAVERRLGSQRGPDPGLGRAFGELGRTLAAYRYWRPARAAFANAETLTGDPEWTYHLALGERALGRLVEAEEAFDRALAADPEDVAAVTALGDVQLALGRLEQARASYLRATELDPTSAVAHFGLGRTALEANEPTAALGPLETAARLQPEASAVRYALATAHRRTGDPQRATGLLEALAEDHLVAVPVTVSDPRMAGIEALARGAMAHEHRGLRAAARGDYRVAAFEFQQAVARDPERVEAWHNLALALLRLGRRGAAEEELTRLLDRHAGHVPSRLLLERLRQEGGRESEDSTEPPAAEGGGS